MKNVYKAERIITIIAAILISVIELCFTVACVYSNYEIYDLCLMNIAGIVIVLGFACNATAFFHLIYDEYDEEFVVEYDYEDEA